MISRFFVYVLFIKILHKEILIPFIVFWMIHAWIDVKLNFDGKLWDHKNSFVLGNFYANFEGLVTSNGGSGILWLWVL